MNANQPAEPQTLEEAKTRIRKLEEKLDEAIEIILKRDDQLTAAERRILELEIKLGENQT